MRRFEVLRIFPNGGIGLPSHVDADRFTMEKDDTTALFYDSSNELIGAFHNVYHVVTTDDENAREVCKLERVLDNERTAHKLTKDALAVVASTKDTLERALANTKGEARDLTHRCERLERKEHASNEERVKLNERIKTLEAALYQAKIAVPK